ncbi:hypothetical protein [Sphingobium sp. MK2]|uniref:hypothetical protein n=1 Tax=Sphingobium sp. MK2 TaxID=3116540 RepID=UPI0032E35CC8
MAAPSIAFTLRYVATLLGEIEALIEDIALGMEPEDGRISIIDSADENDPSTTAFTRDGIENLKELIKIHRQQ